MLSSKYWPLPPRLVGTNVDQHDFVRWHLRLAILCNEDASPKSLAEEIGVTPNILHLAVHRGRCTLDLAKRIEKHYGREYFPREVFCPELFLPVE